MNKKVFRNIPERILMVLFCLSILFLPSCKKSNETPVEVTHQLSLFSEFYVEKGSDSDSSYISFRGIRTHNDTLEIQATSWGIIEYGLILVPEYSSRSVLFSLVGRCGTVTSKTWNKVTLEQSLSSTAQDTLQQIGFTNSRDTVILTKTSLAKY